MIATLLFTFIAAGLVFIAGRRDMARDPRLTMVLLLICGAFPFLATLLPKWTLLPAAPLPENTNGEAGLPWLTVVLAAWATGVLWQLGHIGQAMVKLHRWKATATALETVDSIPVLMSKAIDSPVAAGIWKPVVLVPVSWNEWTEGCKKAVLAHELEHHRRHDPQWRLVAAIACAIHWYHPLVRWITQRYIIQTEFATDRAVIESGIAADSYANSLCDVAISANTPSLAVAMADPNCLESRVKRMLKFAPSQSPNLSLTFFGVIGISSACALSVIDRKPNYAIPLEEIELRLSADPFPGD